MALTDPVTIPSGAPSTLRIAASTLRTAASAVEQVASNVRAATAAADAGWDGVANNRFNRRSAATVSAIHTANPACTDAADALERLANALEEIQQRAKAIAADVDNLATRVRAAEREGATATPPPGVVDQAAATRQWHYEQDLDELVHLHRVAQEAHFDAQSAGFFAERALRNAAGAIQVPPPPPDGKARPFETPGDWTERVLGDVFYDPFSPWRDDVEPYQLGRMLGDYVTGGVGGAIDQANKRSAELFKLRYFERIEGLLVSERRFISPPGGKAAIVTDIFHKLPDQFVLREVVNVKAGAAAARAAKLAGPVGNVITFGTAALDQYVADRDRSDLSTPEKTGRVVASTTIVGGSSFVGGLVGLKAGAAAGAVIGSVIPGVGTAAGAVVGGAIGAVVGSGVGQAIGEKLKTGVLNGWFKR